MEENTIAKQCGLRMKRVRQARNISQQALADMIFTTPQNISKYEKEGINNIDVIKKLSEALGQDLLREEADEEGTVGEVGREILKQLVMNEGFRHFYQLSYNLFGLKENRICEELFKLERIGMCVREQFTNFCGTQEDIVFITAKGIITLKNMDESEEIQNAIRDSQNNFLNYEKVIGDYSSYQEYIDNNEVEKLIRSLPNIGGYRAGYIKYLQNRYDLRIGGCRGSLLHFNSLKGVNCFYDIIVRMILDVDETMLASYASQDYFSKSSDNHTPLYRTTWSLEAAAKKQLARDFDMFREMRDVKIRELLSSSYFDENERMKEKLKLLGFDSPYPFDLYSKDDIVEFVENNLHSAITEDEKRVDEIIGEINQLDPTTLAYYDFPERWIYTGIAQKICDLYGIEIYPKEEFPFKVGLGYAEGSINYAGSVLFDSFEALNEFIVNNQNDKLWNNRTIVVNTTNKDGVGYIYKGLSSFRPLNQNEINDLTNETIDDFSHFQ